MTALLIETSSSQAIIALLENGAVRKFLLLPGDRQLSKLLFPSIQTLLRDCNVELAGLKFLAFGTGPGSFTGTRVGATVAKTLGFALRLPVVGFPSKMAFSGEDICLDPLAAYIYDLWRTGTYSKTLELVYA